MVATRKSDGRWIIKKKFSFAAIALFFGVLFAGKGIWIAGNTGEIVEVLGAFGTYVSFLLGIIFAADVADKRLNGGEYEN